MSFFVSEWFHCRLSNKNILMGDYLRQVFSEPPIAGAGQDFFRLAVGFPQFGLRGKLPKPSSGNTLLV
ncbi:hypothetical protein [Bacillus sp. 2205SS5-2]|uniref:hypothetical protein n=1 Tax=Bacillus sp. 2205SS5-2 TaxID=3109031 RepID=UPI003003C32D